MGKKTEIEDLLGDAPIVKKAAKKAAAPKADPGIDLLGDAPIVKKAAKKAAAPKAVSPIDADVASGKVVVREIKGKDSVWLKKTPIVFAEGERQSVSSGVVDHFKRSKKAIVSRALADKLGVVDSRKLRAVLYSLANAGAIKIAPGVSRASGMLISPV